MKSFRFTPIIAILFFSFTITTNCQANETPLEGLDTRIEAMMADWNVPGMGLAIIKDDKVILSGGCGVRKAGTDLPVNEQTTFAIGSASKVFTTAAIAILVDEGKLSWDDPVTDHLPPFINLEPCL
jgi:CubicO group peptidase (beta-lactamase class C family)